MLIRHFPRIGDIFSPTDTERPLTKLTAIHRQQFTISLHQFLKNARQSSPTHYLIWKYSFQVGIIPADLETKIITSVFKKVDRSDAANKYYLLKSFTSHIIKIFERVIRKGLVDHLESNHLLFKTQHGFIEGRSCLTLNSPP